MSHVAEIQVEIKDLDALEAACKRIGTLELVRDQKVYKWWGSSVGDYPLPEGFTAEDLGKCDHAIRVKGDKHAYEVGVVRARNGKQGYVLHWDFFNNGYGMQAQVGENCKHLRQAYAVEVAKKAAKRQGMNVREQKQQDGSIRLVCVGR